MDILRLIEINSIALGLIAMGLVLWVSFARLLARNGSSGLWAALIGLPLVLSGLIIMAYWLLFFSSERMAIVTHVSRQAIGLNAGAAFTWVAVAWLILSLAVIARKARPRRP